MNFDIDALSIVLNTNTNAQKVKFNRTMLIRPPDEKKEPSSLILNPLPFFTYDVLYPRSLLIKMTYQDRINFFFNMDRFNELLTPYINDKLDHKEIETNEAEYYVKRDRIINKNIVTMLLVLFPTKYPMINELYDSYSYVVNHRKQIHGIVFNPFAKQYFSYLNINGKNYTVKSVTWLNDIMNHPIYSNFLQLYSVYYKSVNVEMKNIYTKIDILIESIKKRLVVIIKLLREVVDKINSDSNSKFSTKSIGFLNNIGEVISFVGGTSNVDSFNYITQNYNVNKEGDKIQNISATLPNFKDFGELNELNKKINYIPDIPKQWTDISSTNDIKMVNLDKIKSEIDEIKRAGVSNYLNELKMNNLYFNGTYQELEKKASASNSIGKLRSAFTGNDNIKLANRSSSYKLQQLIDLNSEENAKEFHKLMRNVYEYTKNETKTLPENKDLLKVGITFINNNTSNITDKSIPRREIYIMIDLIEGIVDDKNKNKINCSYLNEYLGNELEVLGRNVDFQQFSSLKKNKLNDWRVDKNRMLYSVESAGFKQPSTNAANFNAQPMPQQNANVFQNVGATNNMFNARVFEKNNETGDVPNFESINNDFVSSFIKGDVKEAFKNYNDSSFKSGGTTITDNELLKLLMEKNDKFKRIFTKVSKDPKEFLIPTIEAQGDIAVKLDLAKQALKSNQLTPLTDDEKNKKQVDVHLYELYDKILQLIRKQKDVQFKRGDFRGGGLEETDISISNKKITTKKRNISNRTHKR